MHLGGQANQRGYAMAALLVAIAVMAVVMTALLPAWRQQAQREKEAELAFRGEQYARAIYLFQTKNPGAFPPSIDVLVQGRYLRKKYKDPMAKDQDSAEAEFQTLFLGQQPQQGPGSPRGGGPGSGPGGTPGTPGAGRGLTPPSGGTSFGQAGGGIQSVRSKSKEASIRIYNGGAHYNEWNFIYRGRGRGMGPGQQPGMPPGMDGRPGGDGRGPAGGGRGPGGGGRGPGGGGRGPGGMGGPGRGDFPGPGIRPGRGGRGPGG